MQKNMWAETILIYECIIILGDLMCYY